MENIAITFFLVCAIIFQCNSISNNEYRNTFYVTARNSELRMSNSTKLFFFYPQYFLYFILSCLASSTWE